MAARIEKDTMGEVAVPADRYWGAQTQRSLENFRIGGHRFSPSVIRAFGLVKKACAIANRTLGKLDAAKAALIERAADEVIAGALGVPTAIVKVLVVEGLMCPAPSVAVALTLCEPSGSADASGGQVKIPAALVITVQYGTGLPSR